MRKTFRVLLLILAFTAGLGVNNTQVVHVYHGIQIESPLYGTNSFVDESLALWEVEVARRFPDAFVYAVHGNDFAGEWMCQTPDLQGLMKTRDLALELRERFPDRVIVLLVCNPGHSNLGVPGVFYATDSVWFQPDKNADNTDPIRSSDPAFVGNIYEFIDK